jgi:hypothetical protein
MTKPRTYRRPVTNPQAPDYGFNVDVNPLSEVLQGMPTAKQMRVVEIAIGHLDELQIVGADQRAAVEYVVNMLLYGGRPARADITMLVGVLKTHLRQAGVLTPAERLELSEVPTEAV